MVSIVSTLLLTSLIIIPTILLLFLNNKPFNKNSPIEIRKNHIPILGSIKYFTKRWEFWSDCMKLSKSGHFTFRLAGLKVIGLSGEKGREAFFNGKFSFQAGYAILFGASPAMGEKGQNFGEDNPNFNKRIISLLKKENLVKNLEYLIQDVNSRLDELGDSGVTNPFESIYNIVFQLTMRTVGCKDIAEDRTLLNRMIYLYEEVERSATATALLFPWFPGPAKIRKTLAGAKIYFIFQKIVDGRRDLGKTEDDPLQYLIEQGDSITEILTFLIGSLFAGLLNSGVNAAYVLCYLSLSPHWTAQVLEEITTVANKYSPPSLNPNSNSIPLTLPEKLLNVPADAWETEFPIIDLCLKDSIRLHLQGAALRMNISGKEVELEPGVVGGEVVGEGDILAYHLADIHMDPKIYKNPEIWDPARYLPDRQEDKEPLTYLGWGAGRHPCLGMRFAKLEQNLITANFIARYEFNLSNKEGNVLVDKVPKLDVNAHMARKPKKGEEVYLKYSKRV